MGVLSIDHLYVETRRYPAARAFWEALGFAVASEWGDEEHRACLLRAGEAAVLLARVGPAHDPQGPAVHLGVEDPDALAARLAEEESVEVVTPPSDTHWGTRLIRVLDPDGNLFALEARRG